MMLLHLTAFVIVLLDIIGVALGLMIIAALITFIKFVINYGKGKDK